MRFLRKHIAENGRIRFYLCGIKIFSFKSTCSGKRKLLTYDMFSKYVVLATEGENIEKSIGMDIIWQCWWQGEENAPKIIRRCLQSVKRYARGKVILITKRNYRKYISIPDFILRKVELGIIPLAHFSDYIRACLLKKYGGCWIDATCYMTAPIPTNIYESSFFQFTMPGFLLSKDVEKRCDKIAISGSNWFLRSFPNNVIIRSIRKSLENYWHQEDKLIDYFIFHYLLSIIWSKNKKHYLKMPYLPNDCPHLLQWELKKSYSLEIYEDILRRSFIHKLTYKNLPSDEIEDTFYAHIINKME